MSNYSQVTAFGPKDALAHLDPLKVVRGTQIDTELSLISTAIASKVDASGFADGSAGSPSITFNSDTDTGFYRISANRLGLALGGSNVVDFNTVAAIFTTPVYTGDGAVGAPGWTFGSDTDSGFYRGGANTISLALGGASVIQFSTSNIAPIVPFFMSDGAVGAPSITFNSDVDTGIYRVGANAVGVSVGGVQGLEVNSTALISRSVHQFQDGAVGTPGITFNSDTDTGLYRVGANNLGFSAAGSLMFDISSTALTFRPAGTANSQVSTAQSTWPDGAVGSPGIAFFADPDTGLYRSATNQLALAAGGVNGAIFTSSLAQFQLPTYFQDGSVGTPSISFASDTDNGFYRIGANNWALSVGGAKVMEFDNITSPYVRIPGAISIKSALPNVEYEETDAAADNKLWIQDTNSGTWVLALSNDARNASNDCIKFTRSGTTCTLTELHGTQLTHNSNDLTVEYSSFTGTLTGFTANPTGTVKFSRIGRMVCMWVESNITGTSNTTSMTMTGLPASITPLAVTRHVAAGLFSDNGGQIDGCCSVASTGILTFRPYIISGSTVTDGVTGFTASGAKGIFNGWCISYSI